MYIYMGCFGLIMSGYIWLMLGTSGLCFNLFGYFVILPTICLNVLYLRNDNPLSLPPLPADDLSPKEIDAIKEIEVSAVVLELSEKLQVLMKERTPFTNPQYSLQDILTDVGTNEHRFNKALRYNGFSGFRDYINFNRLQYFKEQATLRKDLTVKELMFMSGFTSRSSFYRYFASIEKISPSEYIDRLQKEGETLPHREGQRRGLLYLILFLPLLVFLEYFQSVTVIPAITVPAFVSYFRDIELLYSVTVTEEGLIVF